MPTPALPINDSCVSLLKERLFILNSLFLKEASSSRWCRINSAGCLWENITVAPCRSQPYLVPPQTASKIAELLVKEREAFKNSCEKKVKCLMHQVCAIWSKIQKFSVKWNHVRSNSSFERAWRRGLKINCNPQRRTSVYLGPQCSLFATESQSLFTHF